MGTFNSIDPYTGETIATFNEFTIAEIQSALTLSENAHQQWKNSEIRLKVAYISRLAEVLREQKAGLAALITEEMGKLLVEAEAEIEKCAGLCDYYVINAEEILRPKQIGGVGQSAHIELSSIGCVLGIMPWNFPFWQVFRYAIPTLLVGNVTLMKHAPNTLGCGNAIERLFLEAGFPRGVFQHIIIDTAKVDRLISARIVQGVTLTGSSRAGAAVAQLAGKYLKKTVLELGGSDAFIVMDDADVEHAVASGFNSRIINAGQSCIAAKRFIVLPKVADYFEQCLKLKILELQAGNPKSAHTSLAPLARPDLAQRVHEQVQRAVEEGANVQLGGGLDGNFHEATLLTEVFPGTSVFDEEIFGPVYCIVKAEDDNHAVELANNSVFGLGASIWSKDTQRAEQLASKLNVGVVAINGIVKSDPRMPFGGIKQSGYGRELGSFGVMEFANVKSVYTT